jgi:hypothetical protein
MLAQKSDVLQAPPARDFGRDLWANFKGLFSTDNVVPLTVGATAAGSSVVLDQRAYEFFGGERVAPAIGTIGNVIGNAATLGAASATMFYFSYRGTNERFKSMSYDLTQALVIDTPLAFAVKNATRRERPDKSDLYSFYSGHASATTATATVISHYYPKLTIPAYLVAAFVGFSRIEKNHHWVSDVVAGHAAGYIIGSTVVRRHNPLQLGRVSLAPSVAPGGGFLLNAQVNLDRAR